jgi:hypothetical protein
MRSRPVARRRGAAPPRTRKAPRQSFRGSNSACSSPRRPDRTGLWVAGNGNGALDAGGIVNGAWHAKFEIKNPSTAAIDFVISKIMAGVQPVPTMTLPNAAGFTLYRYIGQRQIDGAGNWVGPVQTVIRSN